MTGGFDLQGTWEKGGRHTEPSWEALQTSVRLWKTPMPGLRLQVEGDIGWDLSSKGPPPQLFPRFAMRLAVILGDAPQFDGSFDE